MTDFPTFSINAKQIKLNHDIRMSKIENARTEKTEKFGDVYAGLAMQAMLASPALMEVVSSDKVMGKTTIERISKCAYAFADGLLKERAKRLKVSIAPPKVKVYVPEPDADHDIADNLVRKRKDTHIVPCEFDNCWCKQDTKPITSTKPHTALETLKEALWVAEDEGQIDEDDFHEAHKWLEACESDLELLRNLMKIIDYHMVAVGDMVGDRENIAIIRMKVRKRLKEIRDANIQRNGVSED